MSTFCRRFGTNFGESSIIPSFRYPDKIAIEDDTKSAIYSQLNSQVNSLAHGILDVGLKKDDIICQLQGKTIVNIFQPAALVFENGFAR